MGIDGFSLSNLGLNINKTSSALASEADAVARQGNEHQIKDIDGVTKKSKAARKDKDGAFNGGVYTPGEDAQFKEAAENAAQNQDVEQPPVESQNVDYSKYRFRYNMEQMIEIYDSQTDEIIRIISPDDAARVLMNVPDVPGFIVNEKV